MAEVKSILEQKYVVVPETYEVKNYNQNEPAFFNIYMHCPISWELRNGRVWEPHLHRIFEKHINKGSVVIEGGCHIGSHSVKLSKLCDRLYCFEPLKQSNDLLKMNLINNNCTNVTVFDTGLSDMPGTANFDWIPFGNLGGSGLNNNPMGTFPYPGVTPNENEKYEINLTTIDALSLDSLDFIKLDVEGYEPKVIMGGIETIQKFRPVISLESWANHYGEVNPNYTKNEFKILIDLNYKMEQIYGADYLFLP